MEKLRVGPPLDKSMDIGAIVAPSQLERIQTLVKQGVDDGAQMWQPSWACPTNGYFYPPTLFTGVSPSATIAQVEIFGPVLVSMTFRTPSEAVALANNTPYGLAASVWTENINLALDIAPKIKAGVVWVNSSNLFDASVGFGGYRESGFGREGGREGMYEYLHAPAIPRAESRDERGAESGASSTSHAVRDELGDRESTPSGAMPGIDRTPKLFIGGKQTRPDAGGSRRIESASGTLLGEVAEGNRKDIRNAVEAAHAATSWPRMSGHARAQVLYYVAENLSARATELASRIASMTGEDGAREVDASLARLFTYAAWADKYDGAVHDPSIRGVALAMHEPMGVIGIAAPEHPPLLGLISLVAPAIAMGNTVVVIPSERASLAATDLYSVIETSDVPAGVVNIVTGPKDVLAMVLAEHDDVSAVWYHGTAEGCAAVERASASNMKRTVVESARLDWFHARAEGPVFLREATQVKNIWIPYGE
jgi:aldehyde dehydrogenase (NAD+)